MMILIEGPEEAVFVHLPHCLTSIPCNPLMDFSYQHLFSQQKLPSLFQVIELPIGQTDTDHYCKNCFTLPIIIPISFFNGSLSAKGKQNAHLHRKESSIV